MSEINLREVLFDLVEPENMTLEESQEYWPDQVVLIEDVKWCSAEPDVGIMHDWPDDWSETYFHGSQRFTNDRAAFITDLKKRNGHFRKLDDKVISDAIERKVKDYIDELEINDG